MEQVCRAETPSDGEVVRLKRLFERNPTSTIFARLADAYLSLGDAEAAVSVCRRGLRYRPSYVTGHLVLGRAFVEIADTRGAEDEFQKVLRLEPDNPAAVQHLAKIFEMASDSERARLLWDRLRVLNPFNPVFRELKSVSDEAPMKTQEVAVGEEVSRSGNDDPPADNTEGDDATGEITETDKVTVVAGEFPFVSLTLARLYASQGHRGLAERVVRLVHPSEADDILGQLNNEAEI